MNFLRCLIVLLLISACSDKKASDINNTFGNLPVWTLEQDLLIEENEDLIFGYLLPPEVTSDGEILAADFRNSTIHHFNPDGSHIGTFSAKGSGPGEINQMGSGIILEDNSYLIFDRSEMRFTKFVRQNNSWTHTQIIPTETRIANFYEGPDETVIFYSVSSFNRANINNEQRGHTIGQMRLSGEIIQDSLVYGTVNTHLIRMEDNGFMVRIMPAGYGLNSISQVFNKNIIVHAQTDAFKFTVKDILSGETRDIAYHIEPISLSPAEKDTLVAQVGSQFANIMRDKMPEFHRVIESFIIADNGDIWVRMGTKGRSELDYDWVVMNINGDLLARVKNPTDVNISKIKNGKAYGAKRDEETGFSIHRFKIVN